MLAAEKHCSAPPSTSHPSPCNPPAFPPCSEGSHIPSSRAEQQQVLEEMQQIPLKVRTRLGGVPAMARHGGLLRTGSMGGRQWGGPQRRVQGQGSQGCTPPSMPAPHLCCERLQV